MEKKFFKSFTVYAVLLLFVFSAISCDLGDKDKNESGDTGTDSYVTRTYTVSPAVSPDGVGVDFETDIYYGLDSTSIPPSWEYDIRIQTIKGYTTDSGTTSKGCPHIKLYKQTGKAYQYALTGKTAFEAIAKSDVTEGSFAADDVEEIDDSAVVYGTGTTNAGKYSYDLLLSYYQTYFVTKDSSNWLPSTWVVGTDEVIFIIKTEEGNYYKLMILGMGPSDTGQGSKPGSGVIEIAFGKIN